MLCIDEHGRVVYQEGTPYRCSVSTSMDLMGPSPERERRAWQDLLRSRLTFECIDSVAVERPNSATARVAFISDGRPHLAITAAVAPYGTWGAELLVVVDAGLTVRSIEVLCSAPDYRAHELTFEGLRNLVGLPLARAREAAATRAAPANGYESIPWRIADEALAVVAQEAQSP